MKRLIVIFLMTVFTGCASAPHVSHSSQHIHLEKFYQERWCNEHNGIMEYRLPDKTRVDCLTDEYAVEVDFAPKWAESVGQSLYYAERTGKKPGVVLIMEHPGDERFSTRLDVLADRYHIKVWQVVP